MYRGKVGGEGGSGRRMRMRANEEEEGSGLNKVDFDRSTQEELCI